jgi:hypothetical protein
MRPRTIARRGTGSGGGALDRGREPDLTRAAANSVRLRPRGFRQWSQGAAELDHVAIMNTSSDSTNQFSTIAPIPVRPMIRAPHPENAETAFANL